MSDEIGDRRHPLYSVSDKVAVGWTDASGNLLCRFLMNVTAQTATTVSVDGGTGSNLPAAA